MSGVPSLMVDINISPDTPEIDEAVERARRILVMRQMPHAVFAMEFDAVCKEVHNDPTATGYLIHALSALLDVAVQSIRGHRPEDLRLTFEEQLEDVITVAKKLKAV